MPFIGQQPLTGAYSKLDSITTSATATYNLQLDSAAYSPASANHLLVSLNGVMQAPVDSFTVSGSTITFASALTSSDNIDFIMALGDVLNIGTPSDGTVTAAKIGTGAVTDAKIATGITATKLTGALPAIDGSALTGISTTPADNSITGDMMVLDYGTIVSSSTGDINIPASYATLSTTYYKWVLPEAGTYLISAALRTRMWGVTGFINYRLYDGTSSAVLANTVQMAWETNAAATINVMTSPHWILTVGAAMTVYLQGGTNGQNSGATSLQSDSNGWNHCTWMRLT